MATIPPRTGGFGELSVSTSKYIELAERVIVSSLRMEDAQFCTGKQDKNKNDIYEGDILRLPNSSLPNYFEVYWNESAAKFGTKVHMKHNKMLAVYPVVTGDFDKCEIVGNIFENSDLIKK